MTLISFFSSNTLTSDQEQALKALSTFFEDRHSQVFLLRGYAGTGKTFLMKGVSDWLVHQGRTVLFAAPTNRAAKLLQYRTQTKVYTLHKLLYQQENGAYQLLPRPQALGPQPVLVVDEASMLGDTTPERAELWFGSGKLLSDLFDFLQLSAYPGTKVLFVGDGAQLPPVGMSFSPALSEANLYRLTGKKVLQAQMTEVVRQKQDSGIIRFAHGLRQALEKGEFPTRLPVGKEKEVRWTNGSQLLKAYFKAAPEAPSGTQIILAYTNEATAAYNQAVRQHYFGAEKVLSAGEFLLVTNNLPDLPFPLTNGELVKVLQVGALEQRTISIKRGKFKEINSPFLRFSEQQVEGDFHFRKAVLALRNAAGEPVTQSVYILENWLWDCPQEGLPMVATFMLRSIAWKEFFAKNRLLYRTDRTSFDLLQKEYVQKSLYTNAVCARFGYAITCHKAQGGEWPQVFVDLCAPIQRSTAGFYRWAYTAVTRASQKVYLRAHPHDQPALTIQKRPLRAGTNLTKVRRYSLAHS